MKLDELNLAGTLHARQGQADASLSDSASPLAWRREMEKAQSDTWFHEALRTPQRRNERALRAPSESTYRPAVEAASPSHHAAMHTQVVTKPAPAASPVARPLSEVAVSLLTPTTAMPFALAAHTAVPDGETLPVVADESAAPIAHLYTTLPLDLEAEALAQAEATDATPAGKRADGQAADDSHLPVRVHIEGDAKQATVWLGVDASARAQLPAVTEALGRWLAQAGYGVSSFVCNGRVVDDAGRDMPTAEERANERAPTAKPFSIEPHQGESS